MANYHISRDGTPGICKAKKGECPLGANQPHFPDRYSAEMFSDNVNEIRASGDLGGYTPDDELEKKKISQVEAEVYVLREMLEELEDNPESEDYWKVEYIPDEIARRQERLDESKERQERLGITREELKEKFAKKKNRIKRNEDGSRVLGFISRGDSSIEIDQMGGADLVGRELSKTVDELGSIYELTDIKFHKKKPTMVYLEDKETGERKVFEYTRIVDRGRTAGYSPARGKDDRMGNIIGDKMTELAKDELDRFLSSVDDADYISSDLIMDSIELEKGFYRSPAGSQATVKNAVKEMKSENIKYDVNGSSMEGYTWTLTGDDGEVKTVKTRPFFHKV